MGLAICEDLWCEDYRKDGESINVTKNLIENGAEFVVNLSASPWTVGKNAARDRRIAFLKEESGADFVPFFYVNNVGVQNNGKNFITFDGGTTVYNSEGEPVVMSGEAYKEELIIVDTNHVDGRGRERKEESPIVQKRKALVRSVQHLDDIMGWEFPWFIGMSGGIDSSVVADILVEAVGAKRVYGITMPTEFNSEETIDSAHFTANALGIHIDQLPIGELADHNVELVDALDVDGSGKKLNAMQRGNVAAKVRGTNVLSNLAAKYGGLYMACSNKTEVGPGYGTLLGDWNGALNLLADVVKATVYELARDSNSRVHGREVISRKLIPDDLYRFSDEQIKPSAELEEEQEDPFKFGYCDALLTMMRDYKRATCEDIMQMYLHGTLHTQVQGVLEKELGRDLGEGYGYALMQRWDVDDPQEFMRDLEWFSKLINIAVFKRIQGPPIPIVSKTAFGFDDRESQLPLERSFEYERLKEKIGGMISYAAR